jgi:hypothetical protein
MWLAAAFHWFESSSSIKIYFMRYEVVQKNHFDKGELYCVYDNELKRYLVKGILKELCEEISFALNFLDNVKTELCLTKQ